jgi:hypothetical protein
MNDKIAAIHRSFRDVPTLNNKNHQNVQQQQTRNNIRTKSIKKSSTPMNESKSQYKQNDRRDRIPFTARSNAHSSRFWRVGFPSRSYTQIQYNEQISKQDCTEPHVVKNIPSLYGANLHSSIPAVMELPVLPSIKAAVKSAQAAQLKSNEQIKMAKFKTNSIRKQKISNAYTQLNVPPITM